MISQSCLPTLEGRKKEGKEGGKGTNYNGKEEGRKEELKEMEVEKQEGSKKEERVKECC